MHLDGAVPVQRAGLYARPVEPGSTRLHVVPSLSGGWVVRDTPDGPSVRRTNTRRGALDFAMDSLLRGLGGEINLHDADGTVVETYRVPARGPRPWWYSPPRISSLVPAVLFLVEGVAFILSSTTVLRGIGVVLAVVGAAQVVVLSLSHRLDRRLGGPRKQPSARR